MEKHSFFPFVPRDHVARRDAQCRTCRRLLPVDQFYTNRTRPVWVRSHWSADCRDCTKARLLAKYQADPVKAAAKRKANRVRRAAQTAWRRHMNPEYLAGMDKAARDRKTASLMKSFHHSLWLYKRYPKGHPHSYSARAALAKIKAGGQTALCDLSKPRPVAKWARDDIDPATALEMLRAMHRRQKDG